ncbi:MAG: glycosyl transferase family 90 [Rhabdochlamydiaceae bacterium]|nr:glycosyl transferase family 90 [Candidatus Amphrikana amoebophyrae]
MSQLFKLIILFIHLPLSAFQLTHADIIDPRYSWMDDLVEAEFAPYQDKGIWEKWIKQLKKSPCKKITHYQIENGVIKGKGQLTSLLTQLQNDLGLPDLEFIYFEADGVSSPRQIPQSFAPILAGSKIKGMGNVILFCDPTYSNSSNDSYNWSQTYDKVLQLNSQWDWDEKIDLLLWRGANTGTNEIYTKNNWHTLTRGRLVALSEDIPFLIDAKFSHILPWKTNNMKELSSVLPMADERMDLEKQIQYKYQIAIDGDTCSYPGIKWRLLSNSLLFLPESELITWFMPALKPYVHYVPIKKDYSDIIHILDWAEDNDEKCHQIADQGSYFAKTMLGQKQIAIYCYKILLQYAKLYKSRK